MKKAKNRENNDELMRVQHDPPASPLGVRETLFLEPFLTKPQKDTFLLFLKYKIQYVEIIKGFQIVKNDIP